ncbi:MAG: FecR domain-containing protein [Sedimentisphaerales bacterium]|nr:FecR domain-containing protein [Sedimentisphaerales bacterium]
MSQDGQLPPEFAEWIVRSLDGTISAEEFALLDREIITNRAARAYYLEFITTYVGLVDLAGVLPKAADFVAREAPSGADAGAGAKPRVTEYRSPKTSAESEHGALPLAPDTPDDERVRRIERYAREQLEAFLEQERRERAEQGASACGWDLLGALDKVAGATRWLAGAGLRTARIAAVCLLVAAVVLIVGLYLYSHRTVAALVESQNARWDAEIPSDGTLWPRFLTLEEGYARITLKKGTDVILQAPTTFEVQTSNRMFLENGWITAKVPPAATGFTVKTPASDLVDFGTEFGLLMGADTSTEVHVFKGKVALLSDGAGPKRQHDLTEGQAATVDVAGHVGRAAVEDRPRLFVRALPTANGFGIPGKRLSLADMIGGGNGLDTGVLEQGLDPSTGATTPGRKALSSGTDTGFQRVPSLPFVDGVFVPDSNDGSALVTSTGISFEQCPITCGTRYEAITDGAAFQVGSSGGVYFGQLAGQTYGTKASPSIGMHPNAGITFDLDAIRNAMPEARIERFRARCGVSENVVSFAQRDADPNAIEVTFWVLLDGQTKFSRTLKVVPAQTEQIDIAVGPRDRFLTLATTHPGEYRYCWAMFAEPALLLTAGREAATDDNTK